MKNMRALILLGIYVCLQSAYGDTGSDCVQETEEGRPQSFQFSNNIGQHWGNYQWTVTIKFARVVVAKYEEANKTMVALPGFFATTQQRTPVPGWQAQDMYLYVAAVNRSMTSVQCADLDDNYALREVYGFCNLTIFVRPKTPDCEPPVLDKDGRFMRIQCHTYVFPRGVCSFAYDKPEPRPLEGYKVMYDHEYLYEDDMYRTTCTLMVPIRDIQWNKNATVVVSAAPNITNYQNYTVSSKVTASLWIVRPTTPFCEVTPFNIDGRFFEVSCHTYVFPSGTCTFVYDQRTQRVPFEGYQVKYDHRYSYATNLYETTCSLIVPVPKTPLPNTNLTFEVSVAPNVTDYRSYTASSNWNIPLWSGAPVFTSFTANKRTGTVHYNEGDNIKILCTAIATPTPRMSLLDAKGVTLYVSDVPGALDYTIYNITCGRSEAYTCVAESLLSSSDQIKSVGSCPSSSGSSSSSNVPVLEISISVIGACVALVAIIIAVRTCKRRMSNSSGPPLRLTTAERRNGYSQMTNEAHTSPGLHQPITRAGNIPSRPQQGNRGALFIILAASSRTPGTGFEYNRSTTINGQEPWSRVHNTAASPPPYDLPSNPPPEYMEIRTQRANPSLYDDRPPEYTFAGSMDA
ncbi:unnamed protein product [Lymnaea stagnalis]|uniref:Uncharacterized protein n=1 Tax=Lymnaea stagnalis TaxID=6523 RepID=A0AAV2HMT3_LYMST